MLEHSALYFSAADLLGDPYEGSTSQLEFDRREREHSKSVSSASESFSEGFIPTCLMVNCWCRNRFESRAMWELYGKGSPESVCIRSNFQKLQAECVARRRLFYLERSTQQDVTCQRTPNIHLRDVWYYDPQGRVEDTRKLSQWWLNKYTRKAAWFREENEVRALFWYDGPDLYGSFDSANEHILTTLNRSADQQALASNRQASKHESQRKKNRRFEGLFLEVNLPKLIDEIVLAPNASHRRKADLERLVKKWGFDIPVNYCKIDIPPRF